MNARKSTLLIRVDADEISGTGHLMRCIALAQAWQRISGKVIFLSRNLSSTLENRIASEGFKPVLFSEGDANRNEKGIMVKYLKKFTPDWVVLDGYHFLTGHHDLIRQTGSRLLVIDDYNHLDSYHADILINQNLGAEKIPYKCPDNCTRLLGLSYVMLRNEFLDQADQTREVPEKAKNILVTMGGADPLNVTSKVIKTLNLMADKELNISLIVGPANRHRPALEKKIFASSLNCRVMHSVSNMKELMQNADLAVSAGGSTAWELCCLGVPAVCIILAENQKAIVREISKAGAGINAGWHEDILPEQLSKIIQALILDKNKRIEIAKKGHSLISGKGADNIVSTMIEM